MAQRSELAGRIAALEARIARAVERSGRAPGSVRLVGVCKTHPASVVFEALALGLENIGENRIQEAEPKIEAVEAGAPGRATWHLIGHLQTNKARRAAALFDWVHSVDSERIAVALDRHAAELGKTLRVLVEVNTTGESAKAGVPPAGAIELLHKVSGLARLELRGLMTIGPLVGRPEEARPAFAALRGLLEDARRVLPGAKLDQLSMGMSSDFEVAIEEGATQVRVGSALFGPRA